VINNKFTNFVPSQTVSKEAPNMGDQGCDNVLYGQGCHTHERNTCKHIFLQDEEFYILERSHCRRTYFGLNAAKSEAVMQFLVSILHVLQNAVSATVGGRTHGLKLLIPKLTIDHDFDILPYISNSYNQFP
jgi:hypothetical protein